MIHTPWYAHIPTWLLLLFLILLGVAGTSKAWAEAESPQPIETLS